MKNGGERNMNKLAEYIESLTDEQINILYDRLSELIEKMKAAGISLEKYEEITKE